MVLRASIFEQAVFNGVDPLRRVGDFKGGGIFLVIFIDKVDFDQRLMQVHPFMGFIMVDPGDTGSRNFQLEFFQAAAVKQPVGKQN